MLCEICKKREAVVHLGDFKEPENNESDSQVEWQRQFCRECADEYYAKTPGMNSSRDLICLSDWYRNKLYNLLELECPEAFDYSDNKACELSGELTRVFLQNQLDKNDIKLNEDGFEMLWVDLNCSHHFYKRADEIKRRRANKNLLKDF